MGEEATAARELKGRSILIMKNSFKANKLRNVLFLASPGDPHSDLTTAQMTH